jgi:cytoskeleton protein RodZ
MSEAGATLGERLRMAREGKGLSAQKAADELHLDGWVIEALEAGDYARIGPAVYGKGHLKRYAGMLGLPANEIIDAYDTRPAAAPAPAAPPAGVRVRTAPPHPIPWVPIAGLAAVLVLAAAVAWLQFRRVPGAANSPVAPPARAAASAEAPPADADGGFDRAGLAQPAVDWPVEGSAAAAGGTGTAVAADAAPPAATSMHGSLASPVPAPAALRDAEPVAGAGRVRLRLSFSADSWVDVHDAGGHRLYAGRGRANSVQTVAGEAPMQVYLGYASGVQLEVNSRVVAIQPKFLAGDVARFEAGADGVLRRDARSATASSPHPRG